ncbi:hypothetical protein FQR65_LT03384 [Abscondita terminalis]|nr:hypothetical protein FQR65_LT03384 [Abscondita terminalis]
MIKNRSIKKSDPQAMNSQQKRSKMKKFHKGKRGWVYLGHIPHGFYEEEMTSYFEQFGKVINARVCRSRKTGKSKGYGFVEFQDEDVAKIAANTMHNYIMFKKRLDAKFIPFEKMKRLNITREQVWTQENYPLKQIRKDANFAKNAHTDEGTYLRRHLAPAPVTLSAKNESAGNNDDFTEPVEQEDQPGSLNTFRSSNATKPAIFSSNRSVRERRPPDRYRPE